MDALLSSIVMLTQLLLDFIEEILLITMVSQKGVTVRYVSSVVEPLLTLLTFSKGTGGKVRTKGA